VLTERQKDRRGKHHDGIAAQHGVRVHEPVRLGERQRPQEHAVHQREDGAVGADPDAERDDGNYREQRIPDQSPGRDFQISKQNVHANLVWSSRARRCASASSHERTGPRAMPA
jgi:hypothetical protein